jgi:hypothetical protein
VSTVFNLLGFVLVITAVILALSPNARRLTLIGAAVGPVLGFWLVAPVSLQSHHLNPATIAHWSIVVGFFSVVFVAWSLLLSAVFSWPIAAYSALKGVGFRISPMFGVIWTAATLPFGYVAAGVGIEISVFSKLVSAAALNRFLGIAGAAAVLGMAMYLWAARRAPRVSGRAVALGLATASVGGICLLPFRLNQPAGHDTPVPPLRLRGEASTTRPLLFIGLDGGSWRLLQPMIEQGRAPTLARLAETLRGTVEAPWPPFWSTPAWGAILTGYGRDRLGVYEDLAATVRGLPPFQLPLTLDLAQNPVYLGELALIRADVIEPTPVPRPALKRPPVWERLSDAGVKTAVIRFPFTYPAGGQADIVISNRVVTDLWDLMGVEVGSPEDLVSARLPSGNLLSWFDADVEVDASALRVILPQRDWPQPPDTVLNPAEVAEKIYTIGQRMFAVTEHLIRTHPDLDVVMLHVTDLDNISHAFWEYRFPEDFPAHAVSRADIDALGAIPDRYVEYIDRQIARLVAAFAAVPNVMIVSDHGQEAATTMAMWKGWHSSRGVFMAGGPDVAERRDELAVSYLDIVPTMLDLLGIERPPDLEGRSLIGRRLGATE